MNYYNEFDPKAARWLQELICQGYLPPGWVDTRSIVDVKPEDLKGYTQCHFFAGIGGWSYALKLAHWPTDRQVWTGSCPCQPFSTAGKQAGFSDERHLWPHFFRLISECKPATVFGEQVASSLGRVWLTGVRADLEGVGYEVGAADLCAAGVGAPHIRQRLFWVAHARAQEPRRVSSEQRQEVSETRDSGADGRMGISQGQGRTRVEPQRPERFVKRSRVGCNGADSSVAHAGSFGPEMPLLQSENGSGAGVFGQTDESGSDCVFYPLGDTDDAGPQGRIECGHSTDKLSAWSSGVVLVCTDGKARRVEPSIFPLAHGVSGRVGLLRGYGNAIVPQVAAEFIQASEEARHI